ncbi:DNA-binding response regulator [Pelagibacterium sediminicola]|uniref:DNA-binding response regulator n=1 Tax=Pelagibacterium sediminicola TaxID=2248761 RepID=UPI000E310B55|nr:DNA-binding response regulator [Pelagibacterium sediminicola]
MTAGDHLEKKCAVILCIEDEAQLRRDIADELAEAGYGVIEAGSGEEALAILDETAPDLILCDISMPGLNGYDVLAAVQGKGAAYAEIPFVFLSALADPRQVVDGKKLGADDYLVKPIDYDLLLATVGARLRQIERIRAVSHAGTADTDTLASRFGLTATEARIAKALMDGHPLADIARDFSVSRTTVAFHMRNIFDKTGTNRQAALVSVLLRI